VLNTSILKFTQASISTKITASSKPGKV